MLSRLFFSWWSIYTFYQMPLNILRLFSYLSDLIDFAIYSMKTPAALAAQLADSYLRRQMATHAAADCRLSKMRARKRADAFIRQNILSRAADSDIFNALPLCFNAKKRITISLRRIVFYFATVLLIFHWLPSCAYGLLLYKTWLYWVAWCDDAGPKSKNNIYATQKGHYYYRANIRLILSFSQYYLNILKFTGHACKRQKKRLYYSATYKMSPSITIAPWYYAML